VSGAKQVLPWTRTSRRLRIAAIETILIYGGRSGVMVSIAAVDAEINCSSELPARATDEFSSRRFRTGQSSNILGNRAADKGPGEAEQASEPLSSSLLPRQLQARQSHQVLWRREEAKCDCRTPWGRCLFNGAAGGSDIGRDATCSSQPRPRRRFRLPSLPSKAPRRPGGSRPRGRFWAMP
jgi:hypothetical protein